MKRVSLLVLATCVACAAAGAEPAADPQGAGGWTVPARVIPVPGDISKELQAEVSIAPSALVDGSVPKTAEEWRAAAAAANKALLAHEWLPDFDTLYPARVEPGTIAGVAVYTVIPPTISARNRNRLLVYVHGGGYFMGAGAAGNNEAILLANCLQIRTISIDYRMPPDHPFPDGLNDAVAVWREVVRSTAPRHVVLGGTSAGGGLALAIVHKLRESGLPLPRALFVNTPWVDLTNSGDSLATNYGIDNVLSGSGPWLAGMAGLYAGTQDLRSPLISPLYGDFSGFPPTIVITGTRDLLLSDSVRVHRRLRAAGVKTDLLVLEAMSHGTWMVAAAAPESREAYADVTAFLDRHLGK